MPRSTVTTFRLRVELQGAQQPVWRELLVPSATLLTELHLVIQAAMGWENLRPHSFTRAETIGKLGTIGELLTGVGETAYHYGAAETWEHRLALVEVTEDHMDRPILFDGAGPCPPEDRSLGQMAPLDLPDAAARVAALTAQLPELPSRLSDLLEQAPGRGPGSVAELIALADLSAAPRAGEDSDGEDAAILTANLRWFLALVGSDGVPLTGAGYLRPAVVAEMAERFQLQREWIGGLNREDSTPGVRDYRAAVRELGLTRSLNGRVRLTKLGAALADDPARLLTHLISRLPLDAPGTFAGDAGLLMMLELAGRYPGPASAVGRTVRVEDAVGTGSPADRRVLRVLHEIGWSVEGGSVSLGQLHHGTRRTAALLHRSGALVDGPLGPRWEATEVGHRFLRAVLRHG